MVGNVVWLLIADSPLAQSITTVAEPEIQIGQFFGKRFVKGFGLFAKFVTLRQRCHRARPSRLDIVGVKLDCAIERKLALFPLSRVDQEMPQPIPGDLMGWVSFHDPTKIVQCSGGLTSQLKYLRPIKARIEEAPIETDCTIEIAQRLVETLHLAQHNG